MVNQQPFFKNDFNLYLIRHGETEWSKSGQYTGRQDIALTESGKEMAKKLGDYLREVPFSQVFSSPLQRAKKTCELVALTPQVEIDQDLTEWNNGDDEGRVLADILKERPEWNLFRDGSPHGESPTQISSRADRFIQKMRKCTGNIAVFSHSHFGRVLTARWLGQSTEFAQHLFFDTASLSILSLDQKVLGLQLISLWNFSPDRFPKS